jgi:glucosamine 6-phosphate synthetase-like amidotransferase/phosphosugar isomerase protein
VSIWRQLQPSTAKPRYRRVRSTRRPPSGSVRLDKPKNVSADEMIRRFGDPNALAALPEQIEGIIAREAEIESIANTLLNRENAYFIGRSAGHAIAMEGALKLKEVSYLHAEAYPESELKHGSLALITPDTPTAVLIPHDDLFRKNLSTIEEIRARRGPVIAVTHSGDFPVAR